MSSGMFLIKDSDELLELTEQPYDSEDFLQSLLAKYPNLMAGDQIDSSAPRRWLLVTREAAVPSEKDGAGRWSVDHVFLDQDGIPTLVEVKRSTDTRIRREVVGQMLDYAANAVAYWPLEEIRTRFESSYRDEDPDEVLQRFLEPDGQLDPEAFWAKVKTNLQASKLRLVFIADIIPPELQRIVEFMNAHMDPVEVLAVEIRQYVGQGVKSLIPRVIGQTAEARQKKSGGTREKRKWDEESFMQHLGDQHGEDAIEVALKLLDWAKSRELLIWWGEGKRDGSFAPELVLGGIYHYLFVATTYGRVEMQFQYMKGPFIDESRRREFLDKLNCMAGTSLPEDGISRRPSFDYSVLRDPKRFAGFIEACDFYFEEVKGAVS